MWNAWKTTRTGSVEESLRETRTPNAPQVLPEYSCKEIILENYTGMKMNLDMYIYSMHLVVFFFSLSLSLSLPLPLQSWENIINAFITFSISCKDGKQNLWYEMKKNC